MCMLDHRHIRLTFIKVDETNKQIDRNDNIVMTGT